ncbi:YafY family transcriptional regulator [Hoyosella rhizosphaerae]|uniref:YafY family transcriptional regulator n=1 Tax=Hoyosella rhizosphaerae TaxID=1755582 RepID=A0A916TZP1_9ACTN|nr:YafY family protein [Hoyosella rhizosphaerae]MBN4927079.1 YafY family transcriptional regulator [Hoyosella rhizosphaerae]GGC54225.1 hypothetical protein GCM10011410_03210 [Hoyosella rhizosphaerae]
MSGSRLSNQLVRLLNLVPYVKANPGISKAALAAELGVTEKELVRELNLLWMCGLPGYGPGDLIDLSFDGETVSVVYTAGMERPLRLTSPEATALLVALRALLDQPGMADPAAVQRAIAKIEAAAGIAAKAVAPATTNVVEDAQYSVVREAVQQQKAVQLRYYSASRDALTDRVVDPIRLMLVDDHTYLQAWCRMAEAVRLFRLDRIENADITGEPAQISDRVRSEVVDGLFSDADDMRVAVLEIDPSAAWFMDYYPVENPQRDDDTGWIRGEMTYASTEWMARLLLGFGGGIRVLSPPELVEAIHSRAHAALVRYVGQGEAEVNGVFSRDSSGGNSGSIEGVNNVGGKS